MSGEERLDIPPEAGAAMERTPAAPICFTYLDSHGGIGDRQFFALCHFVPQVGDRVAGRKAKEHTVVSRVYHRFVPCGDGLFQQVTTVILKDPPVSESGGK